MEVCLHPYKYGPFQFCNSVLGNEKVRMIYSVKCCSEYNKTPVQQ